MLLNKKNIVVLVLLGLFLLIFAPPLWKAYSTYKKFEENPQRFIAEKMEEGATSFSNALENANLDSIPSFEEGILPGGCVNPDILGRDTISLVKELSDFAKKPTFKQDLKRKTGWEPKDLCDILNAAQKIKIPTLISKFTKNLEKKDTLDIAEQQIQMIKSFNDSPALVKEWQRACGCK